MTLEQELIDIFAATPYQRNRDILIGYYGWKDGRQHTLTEIGEHFGITRERVRQVCAKLTKRIKDPSAIRAPVMDRALALIARRLPCAAAQVEVELGQQGLTGVGMSLENVIDGARLLGRPADFRIVRIGSGKGNKQSGRCGPRRGALTDDRLAIRPDQVEAVMSTVDLANKEVYFHGLTTVDRILAKQGATLGSAAGDGRELVRQTCNVDGRLLLARRAGRLVPLIADSQARAAQGHRQGVGRGRLGDGRAAFRGAGAQSPPVERAAAGKRALGLLPPDARGPRGRRSDHLRSAARLAESR